jgi:hypothetical protein
MRVAAALNPYRKSTAALVRVFGYYGIDDRGFFIKALSASMTAMSPIIFFPTLLFRVHWWERGKWDDRKTGARSPWRPALIAPRRLRHAIPMEYHQFGIQREIAG